MDLRRKLTPAQVERGKDFIVRRLLWYQPFILADELEVGEGMNFRHAYKGEVASVYWPDAPDELRDLTTRDLPRFREGNEGLRRLYDHLIDSLVKELGDVSNLSFAEVGCNSGYFLYGLSLRGARQTIGFDFAPNKDLFAWFNEALGANCEFRWAEWDSLHHQLRHAELEEVDVTMSLAVTPHVPDGLYMLPYLCDRARKAVLFWIPTSDKADLSITFSDPNHHKDSYLDFPCNVNSGVQLSAPLVRKILTESGFEDVREIEPPELSPEWLDFYRRHKACVAFRTKDIKTALTGGRYARPVPPTPPPPALSVRERFGRWRRSLLNGRGD